MSASSFQHLVEAKGPEEDWTGIKDPKERRRIQIRLHVRAYRRKQKALQATSESERPTNFQPTTQAIITTNEMHNPDQRPPSYPNTTFLYMTQLGSLVNMGHYDPALHLGTILPLSRDHLIPVIQFNTARAMVAIMRIMGVDDLYDGMCQMYWSLMPKNPPPLQLPEALKPTHLQLTMPHQRWIDLLPHPMMRDNAIRATGSFIVEEMECDVLGVIFDEPGALPQQACNIMVWGEPWLPESYEFSVEFLKKWGFLVKGCDSLLHSTNSWRVGRGEAPLPFWG